MRGHKYKWESGPFYLNKCHHLLQISLPPLALSLIVINSSEILPFFMVCAFRGQPDRLKRIGKKNISTHLKMATILSGNIIMHLDRPLYLRSHQYLHFSMASGNDITHKEPFSCIFQLENWHRNLNL